MYGTTCFSAIINPPQSAILAVGAREKKVLANEDGYTLENNINRYYITL
jgi:pyruvate dehydrogenase E2 component (dihydrolipoamide acetyltransferase)